jgi:hypothetical protein
MKGPAGYALLLHDQRRLDAVERDMIVYGEGAESVPSFQHSSRYPLVVLLSFVPGWISAIATGRLGRRSASGEKRLNFEDVTVLADPLALDAATVRLEAATAGRVSRYFESGGYIPAATFHELVRELAQMSPEAERRLADVDPARSERIARMSDEERRTLAFQKEAVGVALSVSGFDRKELRQWTPPPEGLVTNYLVGVRQRRPWEDRIIRSDLERLPGHELVEHMVDLEGAVFERRGARLSVYLADRNPLEHETGADLLYFNQTYGSWVMVQYKLLDRERSSTPIFRPSERSERQIARMMQVLGALRSIPPCDRCEGYRLSENPFYLKLCDRMAFDPSDQGLAPGMYLPLDYWRLLLEDDRTLGRGGGRSVTYENAGRHLHNTNFISLVSAGWIGTNMPQSDALGRALRDILEQDDPPPLVIAIESQTDDRGMVRPR